VVGNRVKVKIVKNKCAAPFKVAEFDLMFDEGISRSSSVIDLAIQYGILEKSGSWIAYNNEKLGQGREAVRFFLKDNPKLLDEIETKIRTKILSGDTAEEGHPANEPAVSSDSEA
jgi:recombination protein RecA